MATWFDAAASRHPASGGRGRPRTLNATFFIFRHELLSQPAVYQAGDQIDGLGANAVPADVSFQHVSSKTAPATEAARRLPLGIGLVVAATASIGLWFAVAAGLKAIFF